MTATACLVEKCVQTPTGRCPQCGRAYCAQHGGNQAGYGACCCECYARVAQGLLVTSHRAGQLPQAMTALASTSIDAAPPERLYAQALALAATGDLDAAAERLARVVSNTTRDGARPVAQPARKAMNQILSARAVRRLQANSTLEAVDDLRQAIAMFDDSATQRALLSALVHQSALAYFNAGRLTDALREWEEAQARDPQSVQTAHYIGIVCYRLASELEARDPAQADPYWKKAIAHWAMALVDPDYWTGWSRGRVSAVGPIDDGLVAEVRKDTQARLRAEFRDHRTRYLEQKQPAHAERHTALEVSFVRELRAAEEMRAAMQTSGAHKQALRAACGPLMLERWRGLPACGDLTQAVDALARANPALAPYLSPLGACYTMVKDLKRYDEAQAELRRLLKQTPNDKAAQELLVESLVERGRELMDGNALDRAVALFQEAAGFDVRKEQTIPLLVQAATRYARALVENENTIQTAIDLLEGINRKHNVRDPEFRAQWAQAHYMRGLMRNRKKDNAGSLADVRKAIEIDPHSEMARNNLVPALMNQAIDLGNARRLDDALKLAEEAIQFDGPRVGAEYRQVVVDMLTARGIQRANEAVQQHMPWMAIMTRQRLMAALSDLNTAEQLDPGNAHVRQQINTVQNLIRQIGF